MTASKPKRGVGRPKGPPRKRIHVTLSLEAMAIVEEIAELTGAQKASVLAEMFDQVLPAIQSTISALRVAKQQPRQAQRLITNFGAKTVMQLQQAGLELDDAITAHEAQQQSLFQGSRMRRKRATS